MSKSIIFSGSIPQNYEDYLTPFLFDPFADDLVARIKLASDCNALELACGTGCVTKRLTALLPTTSKLTATDLQTDMLEVARNVITSPEINWEVVDMTDIPYQDNQFDLIVCQFGLMLVPEKLQAVKEMYRVLKKGGQLLFNVWGNIKNNIVWDVCGKVIHASMGMNPILQDPGPFSLSHDSDVLELLRQAGFDHVKVDTVNKVSNMQTAARAAKGLIGGLPVFMAISQQDPSLVIKIQDLLELELVKELGDHPMRSSLQALVFETIK